MKKNTGAAGSIFIIKVVEAFSDHLIGIADDDESLIVDLFDDGFELIDLLRFYASE